MPCVLYCVSPSGGIPAASFNTHYRDILLYTYGNKQIYIIYIYIGERHTTKIVEQRERDHINPE